MMMLLALLLQEDLTVLKPGENPGKALTAALHEECGRHFEARRKAVAELKTPEDVRKRQAALRAKFEAALGGFPTRTPLKDRVVGRGSGEGFRFERVVYESRPNHHVTAVLYLPEGPGPFPGILVPCGHSDNGKAAEAYQRASILMAKNGLAALCYDPIGQGERKQLLNDKGQAAVKGSTTEHTLAGIGALLVGSTAATYRIWDGLRSMDYLAGRAEVDSTRLGCAGNSGGGTLTAYLMALDDRIQAAAPSCYITSLERLFATIGPQDAEQNIPGQVAFGMEHADYVTMRAPRATLINVGTQDFFDIQGAWTTYREAKQVYGLLGYGERVDLFEFDDKHGWSQPRRESATRWMRRWLLGMSDAPAEIPFPVFKDAELQCTSTGQVLSDFKGRSVFDLNLEREKELAARRGSLPREELLREVARRIGLRRPAAAPAPVSEGDTRRSGLTIQRQVRRAGGVPVPALLFIPEKAAAEPPVLYVHGEGKAREAGALEALARSGLSVTAIDVRGVGETAPPEGRSAEYGRLDQAAFLGLHLGRPLLGQRVEDLLLFAGPAHLIGVGAAGPVVLHAAALHPEFVRVTVEGGLISWSNVVRTPVSSRQLPNVVPGALEVYDLPDLAAAIAPRPLTIRNPVDATGRPVPQAELEAAYAAARKAYAAAGAEKNLILEAAK